MKAILLCALAFTISLSCKASDPIDKLVAELTHNSPELRFYHFPNGMWTSIDLPATASPAQLLAKLPNGGSFSLSTTNYSIVETCHVRIAYNEEDARVLDPNYTAILVRTPSGQKVVLAQFQGSSTNASWDARVYVAK
jgi:hypothetical protein